MPRSKPISRRKFLQNTGGAALGGSLLSQSLALPRMHASGDDTIRVGIVGCGGRGTGAALQALRADAGVKLVAMGEAFSDRLERSLQSLSNPENEVRDRIDVPPERRFVGIDAYQQVIASDIDVIILTTSPHFRPQHLRAAVKAGLHIFAEKPVAVDAPGVRSVLESSRIAKENSLNLVSGLCYRYHDGRRAVMQRVHDGAIGEIVSMQVNYLTGELWYHERQPEWSDMEWQMRNWLYFTWLSGDHITEQHIHSLDVAAWAIGEYPVSATSVGGRQKRTDAKFGNVYDHFATTYEFANGVKAFSACRQQNGCHKDVSDHLMGSEGRCEVFKHKITGTNPWQFQGKNRNMYQNEQDELFAAIRKGEVINNGEYMCNSTMMAIMGRMSAYTGRTITWDQAWNSQQDLTPKDYAWRDVAVAPIAVPGLTKFM